LKAVDALDGKSDDGRAVVSKMKQLPSEDALFGKGTIRQDGRRMVPVYVFQVKPPSQKNDVYEVLRTVDAADAYRRIEDGNCPLVSK
jgi:branched-chain amino acid transport system substrate-binding protein